MTVITGREFRANQGKYIGMAHRGEEVILTSKKGNVRLTPVDVSPAVDGKEEAAFQKYVASREFAAQVERVRKESAEGMAVICRTPEELAAHLNSL